MDRTGQWTALAWILACLALAAGCATTLPATDFIIKYTTNIDVPNPRYHQLPTRTFEGARGGYFFIKDEVPYGQGGGSLGSTYRYRCPVASLPGNFPEAYKPGDVVLDGRPDTKYTYMIEWYRARGGSERPPTGEWAESRPAITVPPPGKD